MGEEEGEEEGRGEGELSYSRVEGLALFQRFCLSCVGVRTKKQKNSRGNGLFKLVLLRRGVVLCSNIVIIITMQGEGSANAPNRVVTVHCPMLHSLQ